MKNRWHDLSLLLLPVSLVIALPLLSPSVPAQSPAASSPSAQDRRTQTRIVSFSADRSLYLPDGRRVLIGHAHFQEGETHLYADQVIYNEDTKQGEMLQVPDIKGGSMGRPKLQDDLHTLVSDRMTFDLSSKDPLKRVVSALGNVHFVAKPDPKAKSKEPVEPKKDAIIPRKVKEETVLTCNRLDYFYRSKRAVCEGNLKVVQGKRWLTGDQAIYYRRVETVVVNGNVKGEDEKGRTFAADNMKIMLTGDTETIEASQFQGTFKLEEDEEPTDEEIKNNPEEMPQVFPGGEPVPPVTTPAAPATSPDTTNPAPTPPDQKNSNPG